MQRSELVTRLKDADALFRVCCGPIEADYLGLHLDHHWFRYNGEICVGGRIEELGGMASRRRFKNTLKITQHPVGWLVGKSLEQALGPAP